MLVEHGTGVIMKNWLAKVLKIAAFHDGHLIFYRQEISTHLDEKLPRPKLLKYSIYQHTYIVFFVKVASLYVLLMGMSIKYCLYLALFHVY